MQPRVSEADQLLILHHSGCERVQINGHGLAVAAAKPKTRSGRCPGGSRCDNVMVYFETLLDISAAVYLIAFYMLLYIVRLVNE